MAMAPIINGRNLYKNIFNTWLFRKWIPEDPTKGAAGLALASTITKDAVNCYYYTTQSYKNKEIPEDKRKFVAANDLSNGFYNVVVPIVTAKQITNAGTKTFDKYFAKYFDNNAAKLLYEKLNSVGYNCGLKDVEKVLTKTSKKTAKAGLEVLFALVLSQIVCKRIITPLFATPTADHVKKLMQKYEDYKQLKAEKKAAEEASENAEVDEAVEDSQVKETVKQTQSVDDPSRYDFYGKAYKAPKFMKNV